MFRLISFRIVPPLPAFFLVLVAIGACQGTPPVTMSHQPSVVPSPRPERETFWTDLGSGLKINRSGREVLMEATVCLDEGWLEQVLCGAGTREHESLMVSPIPASSLHAALLAAGLRPGRPGRWEFVDGTLNYLAPTGDRLDIRVGVDGAPPRQDIREWITDEHGQSPAGPWVFGGSTLYAVEDVPAGHSRYTADSSGSLIGLVTFGDEVIGFSQVIPDQVAVSPPNWQARTEAIPSLGSDLVILISPTR